jgi:ubiquinone/menaquinone biosynthesis C-methylase UbiE
MTEPTKKEILRDVFNRGAKGYGHIRYFPIFGQWLVDTAQIPSGAKVLDVACGRGAVLFPAAEKVGANGHVTGIDLSESMAQETNAEIQKRGIKQAEARAMDAEHLEFPDESFDYVLCGFSVQFFPHLAEALLEFHRVLKPNGHVVITTWGDDDSRWSWWDELRNKYGAMVKLGSQSLDTPEKIKPWFINAGFMDIKIISKEMDMIHADESEWWNMQWSISGRAGLEKLDATTLEKFKAETSARMQAHREADGFHDRLQAYCTVAKKP